MTMVKKRKIETIDQSVLTVEVPRSNTRASVSQAGRSSQVGGGGYMIWLRLGDMRHEVLSTHWD